MAWKMTVNIKPFIGDDDSDAAAKKAGEGIYLLLSQKLLRPELYVNDAVLRDIIDRLEDVENADEFNDILENLYDWADENRIWLGLM